MKLKTKNASAGFTLVEVIIATTIFAFAAATVFSAIGFSERLRGRAATERGGAFLANYVTNRLQTLVGGACPGSAFDANDLAADVQIRVPDDGVCLGGDVNNPAGGLQVSCMPDYPRRGADLRRIFGSQVDGSTNTQHFGLPADANIFPVEVNYNGTMYRIAWNVTCDRPVDGARTINVLVGWGAADSMWVDNRFVRATIVKSSPI